MAHSWRRAAFSSEENDLGSSRLAPSLGASIRRFRRLCTAIGKNIYKRKPASRKSHRRHRARDPVRPHVRDARHWHHRGIVASAKGRVSVMTAPNNFPWLDELSVRNDWGDSKANPDKVVFERGLLDDGTGGDPGPIRPAEPQPVFCLQRGTGCHR